MSWTPYTDAPPSSFWSRCVANAWDPCQTVQAEIPLIRYGEKIMSAGSCFAANLIPFLEDAGFTYLYTEVPNPAFGSLAKENLSYGKFSAAYGNIYTARQMKQLLLRCLGLFRPHEDRWLGNNGEIIDPFRPGLRYKARSHAEFDSLTRQHLACTLRAFSEANVLIYTLGLTEAWVSRFDGAVFPACPGTIAGSYDADRHGFYNFNVAETTQDLDDFITLLREINPSIRVIVTVSPVPLVATATPHHVLIATTYSKSVLRVAAQDAVQRHAGVTYFPAYEIVTGPQAPENFFETTRRDVSTSAIETVMQAFFSACETGGNAVMTMTAEANGAGSPPAHSELSKQIIEAECEEAFADHPGAAIQERDLTSCQLPQLKSRQVPISPDTVCYSINAPSMYSIKNGQKERIPVTLTLKSSGSIQSELPNPFVLSYHIYDMDGKIILYEGLRSSLRVPVCQNTPRQILISVRAPEIPGQYLVKVILVQEWVAWLESQDAHQPADIALIVGE